LLEKQLHIQVALPFLTFMLWAAFGHYERGNANSSLTVITLQVVHNPFFWVLAAAAFLAAYIVTNRDLSRVSGV